MTSITAVLLGYGVGGFFGNFVGGWIAGRSERQAIVAGGAVIVVLAATCSLRAIQRAITAVAITLWGFAFGAARGFRPCAAPDQLRARAGCWWRRFDILASGAIFGGLMVDHPRLGRPCICPGAMVRWARC